MSNSPFVTKFRGCHLDVLFVVGVVILLLGYTVLSVRTFYVKKKKEKKEFFFFFFYHNRLPGCSFVCLF